MGPPLAEYVSEYSQEKSRIAGLFPYRGKLDPTQPRVLRTSRFAAGLRDTSELGASRRSPSYARLSYTSANHAIVLTHACRPTPADRDDYRNERRMHLNAALQLY